MPYAILRFQKKKSGGVTACYAHNERKKEAYKSNPDIDTGRKPENYHLVLPKQTQHHRRRGTYGRKNTAYAPVVLSDNAG